MNPRICRACGEPIQQPGNVRSRNPNLCASCSSLVDGMGEEFPEGQPRSTETSFVTQPATAGHDMVHE